MSTIESVSTEEAILAEYKNNKQRIDSFSQELERLLKTLTKDFAGQIHSINSRVKAEDSLKRKIRGNKKYRQLSDIHDIVGIRIITIF